MTTTIHFSEFNTKPTFLFLSGFGPPLPVLPSDFTADLLAKLWSGGTFLISMPEQALQRERLQLQHPITHLVTISNFILTSGIPTIRIYLDTSSRLFCDSYLAQFLTFKFLTRLNSFSLLVIKTKFLLKA